MNEWDLHMLGLNKKGVQMRKKKSSAMEKKIIVNKPGL